MTVRESDGGSGFPTGTAQCLTSSRNAAPTWPPVIALMLAVWVSTVAGKETTCPPKHQAAQTAAYGCAKAGDLLAVRLGDLHPTQAVLGYLEVYYRLGRYQAGKDAINKRFDDWCAANGQGSATAAPANARLDDPQSFTCAVPVGSETAKTIEPMKAVVIGPGSMPYLVDGHHTLTSFVESPDGGPNLHVRVKVLENLSGKKPGPFWTTMKDHGWVWLRDENGAPMMASQLPTRLVLQEFRNDPYRGLLYFARDVAFVQTKDNANYQEFHWGTWLRNNASFRLIAYDLTNLDSILEGEERATKLISALKERDTVDGRLTAGELGRIDYNREAFEKLTKGYCDDKPGKLAYAMYYYHNILGRPPKVSCP